MFFHLRKAGDFELAVGSTWLYMLQMRSLLWQGCRSCFADFAEASRADAVMGRTGCKHQNPNVTVLTFAAVAVAWRAGAAAGNIPAQGPRVSVLQVSSFVCLPHVGFSSA